jgi:hypothetical protein
MKKLVIALFVLGMALPSFAGLKVKDVAGTWSYKIETEYETMTGTLVFEADGKELTGEVVTDEGQVIPMTKVEIRDNNVVYFELEVDYNVMETHMTVDGKEYTGTIVADGGELTVKGEKIK